MCTIFGLRVESLGLEGCFSGLHVLAFGFGGVRLTVQCFDKAYYIWFLGSVGFRLSGFGWSLQKVLPAQTDPDAFLMPADTLPLGFTGFASMDEVPKTMCCHTADAD